MAPAGLSHERALGSALDALTVRRVFGEPIEVNGTTIVPVASVRGGGGGGGGTAEPGCGGSSRSGLGFQVSARPVGVYACRDGEVRWEPSLDRNRIAMIVAVLGLAALRTVRMAIKFRLVVSHHRLRQEDHRRHRAPSSSAMRP